MLHAIGNLLILLKFGMREWKTKHEIMIYQVLSGRSNSYLIMEKNCNILVDTGKSSAFSTLSKNIRSLGLAINDISYLILTHTHFDHCRSSKRIKEKSNCKIITSEKSPKYLKVGYTPVSNGTLHLTRIISKIGNKIGKKRFGYPIFEADIIVHSKKKFFLLIDTLKIIQTPGHSEDSISIIVDDEIAIVGDVLFGIIKNSIFPPFADDIKEMFQSWSSLISTNCKLFLPGHGTQINLKSLKKEYEKHKRKHSMLHAKNRHNK